LSVSHSLTVEVPSCEPNMRQRESAVLHRPIESGPESAMALYVVFMEAFGIRTNGRGWPGLAAMTYTPLFRPL
jgi:hypothetical protein